MTPTKPYQRKLRYKIALIQLRRQRATAFTTADVHAAMATIGLSVIQFICHIFGFYPVHGLCQARRLWGIDISVGQPLVSYLGKSVREKRRGSVLNGPFPAGPKQRGREPLWKKPAGEVISLQCSKALQRQVCPLGDFA